MFCYCKLFMFFVGYLKENLGVRHTHFFSQLKGQTFGENRGELLQFFFTWKKKRFALGVFSVIYMDVSKNSGTVPPNHPF